MEGAQESVRITGEHPVAILRGDGYQWTPARLLAGGMYVGQPHVQSASVLASGNAGERPERWSVNGEEDQKAIKAHGFTWRSIEAPLIEPYFRLRLQLLG